jgi:hypothetical protein
MCFGPRAIGTESARCALRSDDTDAHQDAGHAHAVGGSEPVGGLFHEVTLALATSRPTGYQFAFFTIQGPAALASGRLERLAWPGVIAGRITAHGAAIVLLAITSVLFFDVSARSFPSSMRAGRRCRRRRPHHPRCPLWSPRRPTVSLPADGDGGHPHDGRNALGTTRGDKAEVHDHHQSVEDRPCRLGVLNPGAEERDEVECEDRRDRQRDGLLPKNWST